MTTYTSTIHVDVPPQIAFARLLELMMTPSGRTHYTLLPGPTEGLGTRFRYEYRIFGLSIGGTCTVTEYVSNKKVAFEWHGPERFAVGDLLGTWTLTPDHGGTQITVQSAFRPKVPVLHSLAARAMIRGFRDKELPELKAKMEARLPA